MCCLPFPPTGKERVALFMSDSTNVLSPGRTLSEKVVHDSIVQKVSVHLPACLWEMSGSVPVSCNCPLHKMPVQILGITPSHLSIAVYLPNDAPQ
jgi:hypothetical protein